MAPAPGLELQRHRAKQVESSQNNENEQNQNTDFPGAKPILAAKVAAGKPGGARAEWDRALHHALAARAAELAMTLPADAIEKALTDALAVASAAGSWGEVAQLANELEARRRARAATVDLTAERARRAGHH